MLSFSSAFLTQLNNGNRNYSISINMTLASGTTLTINNDDLWSGTFKKSTATSSAGSFDVGGFVIGKVNFSLNNRYGKFDGLNFDLADMSVYLSVIDPDDGTLIGTTLYGKYIADEVTYDGALISFECLDYAYFFETKWDTTGLYTPSTTPLIIVQRACEVCGITLATTSWDGCNTVISAMPEDENLNWIAAIGYAIQICGQFAKMDTNGRLVIGWYDIDSLCQVTYDGTILDSADSAILDYVDDPILEVNPYAAESAWNSLDSATQAKYARIRYTSSINVSHYPIMVTGASCTLGNGDDAVTYTSGTTGYMIDVTGNPFISSANVDDALSAIGGNIVGKYFYSFDVSHLSMPHYEVGDLAWIEDARNGKVYCSFLTNMDFSISNYQQSSCGAETPAQKASATYSPTMKILAEVGRARRQALDSYEAVAASMVELISNGMGLYFTKEEQSDGSYIYYLHNAETIATSTSVWKLTSNGLVVSTDQGATWAIDTMGNALFNVITARGLNADWINTGALTVRDSDNNIIFNADITNHTVSLGEFETQLDEATQTATEALALASSNGQLKVVLSNDYQLVPANSDGTVSSFPDCRSYYTVYYNSVDITDDEDLTLDIRANSQVSAGTSRANHYAFVYGLSDSVTSGVVRFIATYKGQTVEKQFTVAKDVGSSDTKNYFVVPSVYSVTLCEGLLFDTSTFSANAKYTSGTGTTLYNYTSGAIHIGAYCDGTLYNSLGTGGYSNTYAVRRTSDDTPYIETVTGEDYSSILYLPETTDYIYLTLYDADLNELDHQRIEVLIDDFIPTQENIFNALTNYGATEGVYLANGQLYINASYIQSGAITITDPTTLTRTFYANTETGEVEINATSLKIQSTDIATAVFDDATQAQVFNALIGNNNQQGIYLDSGHIYINSSYIKTGTLEVGGSGNSKGKISIYDSSDNSFGEIGSGGLSFSSSSDNKSVDLDSHGLHYKYNNSDVAHLWTIDYLSDDSLSIAYVGADLRSQATRIISQDGRPTILGFYTYSDTIEEFYEFTVSRATFNNPLYATQLHATNGQSLTITVNGTTLGFTDGILTYVS